MPGYRCYFLDHDGHIRSAQNIEADELSQAVDQALEILKTKPDRHSLEIWQGASRLYPQKE
jgi:hypothetical protein